MPRVRLTRRQSTVAVAALPARNRRQATRRRAQSASSVQWIEVPGRETVLDRQPDGGGIAVQVRHPVVAVGRESGDEPAAGHQQAGPACRSTLPFGPGRQVHHDVPGEHGHVQLSRSACGHRVPRASSEQVGSQERRAGIALAGRSRPARRPGRRRSPGAPSGAGQPRPGRSRGPRRAPGHPAGRSIDEPGLALQVRALRMFPGETVDIEVPAVSGNGCFPPRGWCIFHVEQDGTVATCRSSRPPLHCPSVPPFAADALLRFLAAHTVRGVEHVRDRTYHRSLRLRAGTGTVALTLPAGRGRDEVAATVRLEHASDLRTALAHCRALLDLDADPIAIDAVLSADPALRPEVTAEPGLRVPERSTVRRP